MDRVQGKNKQVNTNLNIKVNLVIQVNILYLKLDISNEISPVKLAQGPRKKLAANKDTRVVIKSEHLTPMANSQP